MGWILEHWLHGVDTYNLCNLIFSKQEWKEEEEEKEKLVTKGP